MENITASRLKEARISKGLNLRELEQLTGISRSTLNRYEKIGLSNVSTDKIHSLCTALNVNENWLLNKEIDDDTIFLNKLFDALENDLNADNKISSTDILELIQYSEDKINIDQINDYIDTKKKLLNYNGYKELKNFLDYLITKDEMTQINCDNKMDGYKALINVIITTRHFDKNDLIAVLNSISNTKNTLNSHSDKE